MRMGASYSSVRHFFAIFPCNREHFLAFSQRAFELKKWPNPLFLKDSAIKIGGGGENRTREYRFYDTGAL